MSPVLIGGVMDGRDIAFDQPRMSAPITLPCGAFGADLYDRQGRHIERTGCRLDPECRFREIPMDAPTPIPWPDDWDPMLDWRVP